MLESLREPLESGAVSIARAAYRSTYPARFLLIAAMNPCHCGYYGDSANPGRCRCTPDQVRRYRAKLSGPLLDRIDIHIEVPRVPQDVLSAPSPANEPRSAQIREQVIDAHARQIARQACLNSQLTPRQIDTFCRLDEESQKLIDTAMLKLGLSARAYHRILKLARSIADINHADEIKQVHLGQAIQLRNLDRAR